MDKNNLLRCFRNCNEISVPFESNDNQNDRMFLTVKQIFETYPFLKSEMNWTEEDIVVFYESKLLIGQFCKTEEDPKVLLIEKVSLENLIDYHRSLNSAEN